MRLAAIRALFSNRNYAIYVSGNIVSLTGTWIQNIAMGWLVWEMTRSPFWIGVISVAAVVPSVLAGLAGGVMADRLDRLRVTATMQILCFFLTFALFVLYELGELNIALVIAFKVAISIVVAISQPARMAFIPTLVGREHMVAAVSFGSMVFNTARFVGPGIGAFLIAHGGLGLAFLVNSLSFLAMTLAIAMLRIDHGALNSRAAPTESSMWKDFGSGIVYLRRHRGVSTMFILAAVTVLCVRPISDFLPAIVDLVFGRGVEGMAMLTSSLAVGSFLGGLWAAGRDSRGLVASALLASGAYAICIISFLLIGNFWIGCAILALAGFFTVAFMTAVQTLIQTSVADEVRGRVLSLWFIMSRTGPDVGAFGMGVIATVIGLKTGFAIGAALCVLASLWAWRQRAVLAPVLETVVLPSGTSRAAQEIP